MNQAELRQSLDSYLAIKEALGFRSQPTRILLHDFLRFVESRGISEPIRAQTAVDWACDASSTRGASGQVQRLSSGPRVSFIPARGRARDGGPGSQAIDWL